MSDTHDGSQRLVSEWQARAYGERDQTLLRATAREHSAILAGVQAADAACVHFELAGFWQLFRHTPPLAPAEPKLEALRFYAELRRALVKQDHAVAASSLLAAGYTRKQIADFDDIIAALPER